MKSPRRWRRASASTTCARRWAIAPGEVTCIRMALGPADASGRPRPAPVAGSEYRHSRQHRDRRDRPGGGGARCGRRAGRWRNGGRGWRDPCHFHPGNFRGRRRRDGPCVHHRRHRAGQKGRQRDRPVSRRRRSDRCAPLSDRRRRKPGTEMPRGTARNKFRTIPLQERLGGFELVEQAWDRGTATREAMRCLSCDLREYGVEVNAAVCKDCGYCMEVCGLGRIRPVRELQCQRLPERGRRKSGKMHRLPALPVHLPGLRHHDHEPASTVRRRPDRPPRRRRRFQTASADATKST